MILKAIKLRFRRHLRIQKRQVEELGAQAEQQLERNFIKRLERLAPVKGFVASWMLLLVLLGGCVIGQMRGLSAFYQDITPPAGGTYTEGVLGPFTNANPIYASGLANAAVSRLLFSGLLTYDEENKLVGDLAESWTVDARETSYLVKLRPGLTWHDGKPLTSADVLFTYQVIQNPDAQSPLGSSWRGIEVSAPDPLTVKFILPGALSAFPQSLTNGIIPKHILDTDTGLSALRTSQFNTSQPVGSGPFRFSALEVLGSAADTREERIALTAFDKYHLGKPKLDSFVIRTFRSEQRLVDSFKDQEINAMVGLTRLPADVNASAVRQYGLPLTAQVMTFFKTSEGLLADKAIRHALLYATDRKAILNEVGYPTRPVTQPFLMNQKGYFNPDYSQGSFDLAEAKRQLDKAGWRVGKDGVRYKGKTPLSFNLVAQDSAEYAAVARTLAAQWRAAGVDVELIMRDSDEFQAALAGHSYDALLYGISVGADPDVFVYWHSTQADIRAANRLNFSEWSSGAADVALESGRTRSGKDLRIIKYEPFMRAWRDDVPAVGLYQPRFFYVTRSTVYGLNERVINADVERFKNVHNWMIRTVRVSQE